MTNASACISFFFCSAMFVLENIAGVDASMANRRS